MISSPSLRGPAGPSRIRRRLPRTHPGRQVAPFSSSPPLSLPAPQPSVSRDAWIIYRNGYSTRARQETPPDLPVEKGSIRHPALFSVATERSLPSIYTSSPDPVSRFESARQTHPPDHEDSRVMFHDCAIIQTLIPKRMPTCHLASEKFPASSPR